jgi:hypothetical protein
MCSIERCDAEPVAKGLCARHYMRQRRQGSPDKTGKPGRPRGVYQETYRPLFRNWSPRKLARHIRAMRMIEDDGLRRKAIEENIRHGVNVSSLEEAAEFICSKEFEQ